MTGFDAAAFAAFGAALGLLGAVLWRRRRLRRAERVIVDGSNVLYWRDQKPDIATVRSALIALKRQGKSPAVVFDANAGYLVSNAFMDDAALHKAIGKAADLVIVAPKGTPADGIILRAARDTAAPVISNDRFRDWADQYPEIRNRNMLVRGRWRDGRVIFDWPHA